MKRLVKKVLRLAWRATAPVRRPIVRKIHNRLVEANMAALAQAEAVAVHERVLPPLYWGFEGAVQATHHAAVAVSADVNLVLNSVVRELARLQMQVEVLQQMVEENARPRTGLAVVDEAGDELDGDPCVEDLKRVG